MMTASAKPIGVAADPILIQVDDNTLLPVLCGEHDRHLARIEQLLKGITIQARGNRIAVVGPQDLAAQAGKALVTLHRRARKGRGVDMSDVDAAVRMADDALAIGDDLAIKTKRRLIEARSPTQIEYVKALTENELVFGVGPAGTGKTYLAVAVAANMLETGRVNRLILSRPAVEAGERLGFLPGDMKEKIDPYLRPLYDALHDMMPAEQVTRRLGNGEIEIAPLAFMRGRTLTNAFIILDEAQNTTPTQMKMFLTRLGENSRMAITGDLSQIDLPLGAKSGLRDALEVMDQVEGAAVVRFSQRDIVRHPLVTRLVQAYDSRDKRLADLSREAEGSGD